jgi:hypothetical protein
MDRHFLAAPHEEVAPQDCNTSTLEQTRRDDALDEALRCTFPASDPIALDFSFALVTVADRQQQRMKADRFGQVLPRRTS